MPFFSSMISWLMKKRIHQIELFMKYPHDVQSEWLRRLVQSARDTEWGRLYGYKSINNWDDFRNQVPVSDYDGLKPWIDRLRAGEQNLLWNTEIKWFAKSSGTTSDKSKFIPVSYEALEECHFKGGKDLLSIYCNNHPDTHIFDGRSLAMGGSHTIREVNNESYYDGDLSAILMQNLPFWAEFLRTPQLSVALMDEWESKIEMMASVTSQEDVTNIAGVPSWTLLLMKKVLQITGKTDLSEVWPNLELFFHGGVSFSPYREQFRNLISSPRMNYVETYNASEGFFGIQDQPGHDSMLLMLDYGIYYEFMPLEELGSDNPRVLSLEQVQTGQNYALIISTNAGLWRYMIGDTVMFTELLPYRIRITGRTRNFINAFGEELIVDNAENALATACRKCHAVVNEYTAAPVYSTDHHAGAHEWLIEFEIPPENIDYFTETFDNALKSLNSDYEAKRYHNMILREPIVRKIPRGTFYEWLKLKGKLGGQHKVPRLSNERKYVDEVWALAQKL